MSTQAEIRKPRTAYVNHLSDLDMNIRARRMVCRARFEYQYSPTRAEGLRQSPSFMLLYEGLGPKGFRFQPPNGRKIQRPYHRGFLAIYLHLVQLR